MIGLSPSPAEMNKGDVGPTRAGYDWNVQQSPGQTANRWARRGGSAWLSLPICPIIVGSPTTIVSLRVVVYGTPLASESVVLTLQKNGVDTSLTATLAAGASSALGSGSVTVVAGDYLTLKANQSGTTVESAWWGYILAAD